MTKSVSVDEQGLAADRRRQDRNRRRRLGDRRAEWPRFHPPGILGRALRAITGSWTSANGMSWFRLVLIVLFVRWALLGLFMIPSSSMAPTLHGDARFFYGDRVAVNKLAYGLRAPFTAKRLVRFGEPKRWDIVVFNSVSQTSEQRVMIKRVAGLPGEKVHIENGTLYIDGDAVEPPEELAGSLRYMHGLGASQALVRDFLLEFARRRQLPIELARESGPEVKALKEDVRRLEDRVRGVALGDLSAEERHALLSEVRPKSLATVRDWWTKKVNRTGRPRYGILRGPAYAVVPDGHYYCLGDNGPESVDSRFFGWVPHENLIGRAFAVALPASRARDLTGFSRGLLGRVLLYGIPVGLVFWEIVPGFVVFPWRVRGSIPALGLERGDRVVVSRLSFGLRIPFSNRRFRWRREPKPGEVVCYSLSDASRGSLDLYFGEVRDAASSASGGYVVRGPSDNGDRWVTIARGAIVGRLVSVWWPLGRARRIRVQRS